MKLTCAFRPRGGPICAGVALVAGQCRRRGGEPIVRPARWPDPCAVRDVPGRGPIAPKSKPPGGLAGIGRGVRILQRAGRGLVHTPYLRRAVIHQALGRRSQPP